MTVVDFLFLLICGLGVINSLILAGYISLISTQNKLLNRILALLLTVFSIRIAKHLLVYFNKEIHSGYHIIWFACLALVGPLLYFLILSILSIKLKNRIIQFLHFIPALTLTFCIYVFSSEMLVYYCIIIEILCYIIISSIVLYKSVQSNSIVLAERKIFALIVLLFVFGVLIIHFVSIFLHISFFAIEAVYFSLAVYVIALARLKFLVKPNKRIKNKQKANSLSDNELELYKNKIINYLESNNPYLNPNITLPQVANELNITHHFLSKVINEAFKLNFNDFINSYRIDHAKVLLKAKEFENYKISTIASESGFNSISAFNAAFKRFTKTTPSKYQNSI